MKSLIYLILAFFPSFIHIGIRRLMGCKIGKRTKLRFGSLIFVDKFEIGSNSVIGPFTFVKCKHLKIGSNTGIKPLVAVKTLKVELGDFVHIAPLCVINSEFTKKSNLKVGDHSRLFPFCWLDTGEGIEIGSNVGVGGHTLMFTHGVWSNYIEGGPISFGPIKIEDNVWLPWRVFVLPSVTIGENSIIGANSLLNKSVEKDSLVAGSPAKVLKKLTFEKGNRKERFNEILLEFSNYLNFKNIENSIIENDLLIVDKSKIVIDQENDVDQGDLLILLNTRLKAGRHTKVVILDYSTMTIHMNGINNPNYTLFIGFLRRFGVRLYIDN